MVSREEYLSALDIVEAYHKQIGLETSRKSLMLTMAINRDEISSRLYNCLSSAIRTKFGIHWSEDITHNHLVQMHRNELRRTRHLGKVAMKELDLFMSKYNIKLKGE